jgi:ferredoxin-NADP reductase
MTLHLRFVRQQHEAENAVSFFFQPESSLQFRAGQYLRYTLPHADPDNRGVTRNFSIASSPEEPLIRLTTRLSTPGSSFKQALGGLQPGLVVEASGPFGNFVYADSDLSPVFIAGGIGITPVRSILGDLARRTPRVSATLLYSNATQDIPFRAEIDSLSTHWPELHVVYTLTRPGPRWEGPTGRITGALIRELVDDLHGAVFFVSGPTLMVDAMRAILADSGVDANRVKREAFPGYDR